MSMPKNLILDRMLDSLKVHPIKIYLTGGTEIIVTKITGYITATNDKNKVIGITVRYQNGKQENISTDSIEKIDL